MTDTLSQRLAELHRRRSAIDAEIADLYAQFAAGEKPRKRKTQRIQAEFVSPEAEADLQRALAKRGIR